MNPILSYSFSDVLRSRWTYFYILFFLLTSSGLLYFSADMNTAMASLMNIVIMIIPLVSVVFGITYYYNSRDFVELLLSQPVRRSQVFTGQYTGLTLSLVLSFVLGLTLPFLLYGFYYTEEIWNFAILMITGMALTCIFTALAFLMAALNEDKMKGFGLAIVVWLFFTVLYDGLLLLLLLAFEDYPLETPSILVSLLNPVDLSRILVLLKLDISALMGYTGAVFHSFFGTTLGMTLSLLSLLAWIGVPTFAFLRISQKKDF